LFLINSLQENFALEFKKMKSLKEQLLESKNNLEKLLDNLELQKKVSDSIELIDSSLKKNLPLMICGNGGSASDSMHIAGELVGRFLKERKALNVICLSSNPAVITAWANDYSYETIFARQVEAYGKSGGVLLAISTSGNSKNILSAVDMAKTYSVKTIALTGEGGGKLKNEVDILLDVPSKHTPRIQEMHIMLYHYICERLEEL
jgi:D-sedoheptulose 7-phosphate isomerase